MKRYVLAAFCSLVQLEAQAASPWDGAWFVDAVLSRRADRTFDIVKMKEGMWKYDDGTDFFVFSAQGGARVGFRKDVAITAVRMSGNSLDYVESCFGRETGRVHMALSTDEQTLAVHEIVIAVDGVEIHSDSAAVRVGKGSGFAGRWKIGADDGRGTAGTETAQPAGAPAAKKPGKPAVVIFNAPDGTMSWYFPSSGEVLRGKVDGRRRPITGPLQPSNLTFTWNQASTPNCIVFVGRYGDHVAGTATEELSDDGATLTDTFTVPGSDRSSVFVMHKQ